MFSPLKKKSPVIKVELSQCWNTHSLDIVTSFLFQWMPRFFCTIINKCNLSRETTQMACRVSFQVDSPAMTTAESCLVLIEMGENWLLPFSNICEQTEYLYTVISLPNGNLLSWLLTLRVVVTQRLQLFNDIESCLEARAVDALWGKPRLSGCRCWPHSCMSTASHRAPCLPCGHTRAVRLVAAEHSPLPHTRNLSHTVVHCDFPGGECGGVFPTAQALERS